ncbi:MAG: glycoside hydrolase family 2 protein [Paenibacillaceae bacterium]|nr:glycoside hydrolase family 2 protein [Paenibacillaceae bacterium]
MFKLQLNGAWQFRRTDETSWRQGRVPGTLLSDLLALGAIEDPFYRDNEDAVLKMFDDDYEYARTFQVSADLLACDKLAFVFEGLDTLAEVYVNGIHALSTDNMFRTYELDARTLVREGDNELRVVFRSPVKYMLAKQAEKPLFGIPMVVPGYTHLRKAHYMSGWDWGPKLPDCGIWRSASLCGYRTARLADVSVRQRHEGGAVSLQVAVAAERFIEAAALQAVIVVTAPDGTVAAERTVELDGSGAATADIAIAEPRLWWPNGYGEQPLYGVEVRLQAAAAAGTLDERQLSVGLRTLTVNTEPDEWGRKFAFEVNGVAVFSMGADYIPEDNLLGRTSRERSEQLIRDCVAANFNTIRVWGGGLYPDGYFYELCDQYGMIVWQDLMFACGVYDLNESFVAGVNVEIADNVRRIRHHACLGLICGNNEIEMFFEDGRIANTDENRTSYIDFFERGVPAMVAELAPDTFYWPGSPSSGGDFFETNGENYGDGHYWEVWHNNKPFTEYRKTYFRYMSEFGFESLPHERTIESFTLPGERNLFSYVMECHQKNPSGNQKILMYLGETLQFPRDFRSLVYASQILQAEAMRYGVEHWRRNRGRCMGTLYWQLNDCWPVSSWASIDYFGRWKVLHYAAKRFYAPVLLSAREEGTRVELHVTNETMRSFAGTVRWFLRSADERLLASGTAPAAVGALATGEAAALDFAGQIADCKEAYLQYELAGEDGAVVSKGTVLFVPAKHFSFRKPHIAAQVAEADGLVSIRVGSDALAKFVELELDGQDVVFSDNYFDLSGGESVVVTVPRDRLPASWTTADIAAALQVRSYWDTYAVE